MNVVLIAAVAERGVIGQKGKLPWYLPADLRRFKKRTMGKPVIMGRRTFESILEHLGKPLSGRYNIVLTRSQERGKQCLARGAAAIARNPEGALEESRVAMKELGASEIMVIGGESVYKAFMPYADRLDLTLIHKAFPGDAYFPCLDRRKWEEITRKDHTSDAKHSLEYSFVTYRRTQAKL